MKLSKLAFLAVSVAFTRVAVATMVGFWPMDEPSGSTVLDISGLGNHGSLVNDFGAARTQGMSGGAIYFSGVYGPGCTRVEVLDTPSLRLSHSGTFAVWVRCDDTRRDAPILAKEGPAQQLSYWFGVFGPAGQGSWGALMDQDGWQGWDFNGRNQGFIAEGQWVHLAFSWDGSQCLFFKDGAPVNSATWGGTIRSSNARLFFGSNSEYTFEGNRTSFLGAIDEVRVFDHAVPPGQIAQWARVIRGQLLLSEYVGPVAGVRATARLYQGGELVETKSLTLDADGAYAFHTDVMGEAVIVLKASHWLGATAGALGLDAPVTLVPPIALANGDVDGNNQVDSDDFDVLVAEFGTEGPAADLTGSGLVDSDDFDVLVAHFGAVGD